MAVKAVASRGVSIAPDCQTFSISESCYRYERKLSDENAEIADWLEKLTDNRTVRYEWLDQNIFGNIEEAQEQATNWLWTYNNDRPNTGIGGIGGITPALKLKLAA